MPESVSDIESGDGLRFPGVGAAPQSGVTWSAWRPK